MAVKMKKDAWVKKLHRANDAEVIADLIKSRIEFPNATGPWIESHKHELPTDIIADMILSNHKLKDKLSHGIGCLLFKVVNGQFLHSNTIANGVFKIISRSKITMCHKLQQQWLEKNVDFLKSYSILDQSTYNEALIAYAYAQPRDAKLDEYWQNIWLDTRSYWWATAFFGLFKQNTELAQKEIPLLIERLPFESFKILHNIWMDTPYTLEKIIYDGLIENKMWAGTTLNKLISLFNKEQKIAIFKSLEAFRIN
jgi:hypothetical protein